jgi:hypothetical protein
MVKPGEKKSDIPYVSMKRSTHSAQLVDQSKLNAPSTNSPMRRYIPFIASVVATLAVLLVIASLSHQWLPLNGGNLVESGEGVTMLLVVLATLTSTTLVASVALAIIFHRLAGKPVSLTNTVERSESGTRIKPQTPMKSRDLSSIIQYEGKHLLRLNQSTERLVSVEEDLIRRISENYDIDRRTHRLMTEIQICTNRILSQLQEIESAECVAADEPSDVKLDDVTIG